MELEIEREVRVKSTGQKGILRLLIGVPYRKAWVSLYPGADAGYQYVTLRTENGFELETLNEFDADDLEVI